MKGIWSRPIFGIALLSLVVLSCNLTSCGKKTAADAHDLLSINDLNQRSESSDGTTLFTGLPVEYTGVGFINPLDTSHPMKRLYAMGYAVGGVAIGDLNGDALPDLFFTSGPRENALYLQKKGGKLEFEEFAEAGVDGGDRWGTGAAMVDIDNDGDLDLYVCNYEAPNQLFLNDGKALFTERAQEFGLDVVSSCLMPTFADVDNDGDLDLFVLTNQFVREGGQPVDGVIYQGGAPTVKPEYRKYFDTRFVGTFEQGGKKFRRDEVYPVGQKNLFFLNKGVSGKDGQIVFEDFSDHCGDLCASPGKGLSATWWDFNADGLLDLYVGNDFEDPDHLYLNQGIGKSGSPVFKDVIKESVPHTTWYSMGADVADVNNDGLLDFFSVDMAATTHFKQKVSMGDMASRGWFMSTSEPRQLMRNALLINTGTGRFQDAAYMAGLAKSDWSWAPKLADFDNDGMVDVFISNGMARPFTASDIIKNRPLSELRIGRTDWDIFEKYPPQKEKNLAFVNRGNLSFEETSAAWGLDHEGMTYAAAYGDLDRDGDLDLVTVNLDEPVGIYRNDSADGNRILVELRGTRSNRFGIGALVKVETTDRREQVRQMNPATGFLSSNDPALHFGLGSAATITKLTVNWPSGMVQVFEDLEAGKIYTITEEDAQDPGEGDVPQSPSKPLFSSSDVLAHAKVREREFDDFSRQPLLPNKLSQLGPGIAVADVNGDGLDDLYLGGACGWPGALYLNEGGKKYGPDIDTPFDPDAIAEDMGAVFFDCDGDGDQDLYVVSGGYEAKEGASLLRDRLYLNDGQGNFSKAQGHLPELRDSGGPVAAADFNRDGSIDLFVGGRVIPGRYPVSPQSRILQNDGSGKFSDVTGQVAPQLMESGMATGAVWSDADNDGWLDLLVSYEWGPVRIFRNRSGVLEEATTAAGLASHLGWWSGISAGDVDNDGDIDYVATNFGLNSKYHATADKPALLYYGDFEGDGTKRLIEAEYEDGVLYPVRGKSCSTRAIPHLAEKFETFKSFAVAELKQIYRPECFRDSLKFTATTLESGIFINDGSARFEFHPLPRIAQISPAFGSALIDCDGDGNLDLYLVQNHYTPQLETGRMAGGLSMFLRGRGDGTFEPVSPRESGLVVPGDAKGLACADLNADGRPDFVVGINDIGLRAFINQSDRKQVAASTDGVALQPGDRVEATLEDGRKVLREVHVGSGYLSQSSSRASVLLPAETQPQSIKITPLGKSPGIAP
jgi:hypothetical protein